MRKKERKGGGEERKKKREGRKEGREKGRKEGRKGKGRKRVKVISGSGISGQLHNSHLAYVSERKKLDFLFKSKEYSFPPLLKNPWEIERMGV